MTPWLLRHNTGALDGAPESYVNRVADTGDGFVFATQYDFTHITKIDYDGNVQWQLTDINTYEAVVGADASGNVFILDHARLTKVNSAGVIQWQKGTSTGFIAQPELTVLADGTCIVVSGNTNTVLRVAKFSAAGLLTFEKTYTGTDEVVNATKNLIENATGDLYHFSTGTSGDDYLRLTKHTNALAVTWTKSYKTASSSYAVQASCKLSDGSMVVGFLDASTLGTLRLALVAEDGTVTWSKSITDSNVSSYFTNTYQLWTAGTGFVVCTRATAGPIFYKLDSAGALEWARVIACPDSAGGWIGGGVVETANGLLVSAAPFDASANAVASCFYLRSDGTPTGEFATGSVEITNWTSVSVAAGATLTVASDSDSVVAATAGTVTTAAAEVSASAWPLLRYTHDLLQTKQAAGSRKTQFGTPNSPFAQAGAASGSRNTLFGTASSFSFPASGATICLATGTKTTKFGLAVDNSSIVTVATGTLGTHFGTGQGLASYAATGYRGSHFGAPNGAVLTYAAGSRNTAFGAPAGLVAGAATGSRNTRYGTALSEWGNTGAATGYRGTHFGAPGSLSVFRATGSYHTRYGTARVVRSIPC